MMHVTIHLGFETSHRLPHLGGKCVSLHGHSWKAHVTVSTPAMTAQEIVVDFGPLKRALRTWVEANIDHGVMLGTDDPLVEVLREHECRLFVFGEDGPFTFDGVEVGAGDLHYPTVENVAILLARVASGLLGALDLPAHVHVSRVVVDETPTNTAEWTRV